MSYSYWIYDGTRYETRPEYDGKNRYAIEIWCNDSYPSPHELSDNPWRWAGVESRRGDTLPADSYRDPCTGELKPCRAASPENLFNLTLDGTRIAVPIVGSLSYSQEHARLSVGSWQAVRDGKQQMLAEAFCAWEDLPKWFGRNLSRRELFDYALQALRDELEEYAAYVEYGTWGYVIVDLLFGDDGVSCGGYFGDPDGRLLDDALWELSHMEQDVEGDHHALAYLRRFT